MNFKIGPYNHTHRCFSDFPSYEDLRQSLVAMRNHAEKNQVTHIAMPKIGCGLDKLEWNAVRTLIKNVFLQTDIQIDVYHLESTNSTNISRNVTEAANNCPITKV